MNVAGLRKAAEAREIKVPSPWGAFLVTAIQHQNSLMRL
jgi:hypothetical protein